jgi:CIC family chloride channel protein
MWRKYLKILLKFSHLRRLLFQKINSLFGQVRRVDHIFMVLAAIFIGILGAFGAIGFRFLIKLTHRLFFQTWEYSLTIVEGMDWWVRIILPAIGGLLVGPIVYFFAREVKGSGVPEVMEAVAIVGGTIRVRVVIAKAIAAAITIGSGGSAGREGPIIQIGSAIGSSFGQFLSVSARRLRTFVGCGAAAGIAATFNAPIAGALFAVEVILGDFAVTQFSPIVISSVVATVISRHFIGDFPAFRVPAYEVVSAYEFIPYTILGILAGLIAVLFIISVYKSNDYFDKLKIPHHFKPAVGGLGIGLIALYLPQVYGVGYESINDALWGKDIRWLLFALIFAKIIATSLTLGSGGSGGIFAPSLFIGAMLGSLIGKQAHILYPELTADAGAYALVGMGALVAATTHAPISAILIIFELTNDYHIIPPLMISCIISVLIATYIKKESIYTMKLVRRGLHIFEGRDVNLLRSLRVNQVITQNVEIIPANSSFTDFIQQIIKSTHHEYFVVDRKDYLIGQLSISDIKEFLKDEEYLSSLVIASDLAHPPIATFYKDDNLDLVMHQFGKYDVDELPVVESRNMTKLIGSVRRKDVIDAYNREIFKSDLAGGVHSIVTAVQKERKVELADGYCLAEVEPPDGFVGKTLKDLNIRVRFGVEVILIRNSMEETDGISNRPGALAKADYSIKSGDKLLVLGDEKSIENLKRG